MKYRFLIIVLLPVIIFAEDFMNENIPENTLFMYCDNNGIEYYIVGISEYHGFNKIGIDDYFLYCSVIIGNYPQSYSIKEYILHIIPENNIYRFEIFLNGLAFYEYNDSTGHAEPSGEWDVDGDSKDENNINKSIMEYYIENIK